jgi:hypothetical protein
VWLWLVGRVARLVDAVANPSEAGEGGELGEAPCPAQEAESLELRLRYLSRRAADGLAKRDLVVCRPRGPLRSVGDKRRALCGVGPASGLGDLR